MKHIAFILTLFLYISVIAQKSDYDHKRILIQKGYYDSGELKFFSKTIRNGIDKPTGRIYGKQTIKLKEYYKNGKKRLKEKKILPRIVEEQHLFEDRHVLHQKQIYRKYKIWNKEGKLIEKGKYTFRGNKKVIKYNYQGYKKVIIKFDRELGQDIFIKKKPIYK